MHFVSDRVAFVAFVRVCMQWLDAVDVERGAARRRTRMEALIAEE
jgi:hypothetical protein